MDELQIYDALDHASNQLPCPGCGSTTWRVVYAPKKPCIWTCCSDCIFTSDPLQSQPAIYAYLHDGVLKPATFKRVNPTDTKKTVTQELPPGATLTMEFNPHGEDVLKILVFVMGQVHVFLTALQIVRV